MERKMRGKGGYKEILIEKMVVKKKSKRERICKRQL